MPKLRRLFVRDGRLRSGWRLLAYALLILLCSLAIGLPITFCALFALPLGALPPLFATALSYPGIWLATWLAQRFLTRAAFADLGFQRPPGWEAEMLFGVALGAGLMLAIFALEAGLGWVQIVGFAWQEGALNAVKALALGLGLYIAVAFTEELMVRGYILQTLAEGLPLGLAVPISSVIFGLLHASNPNASWVSTLNLVIAGIFLALGYVVTRRLWLPIGLHFGWNFFQGTLLGFPVSGTESPTLIRQIESGPDLITGGAFGPEAGLTGLVASLIGIGLILAWGRLHGQPRWQPDR